MVTCQKLHEEVAATKSEITENREIEIDSIKMNQLFLEKRIQKLK